MCRDRPRQEHKAKKQLEPNNNKKDSKWELFRVMTELLSRAAVEDVKGVKGNTDTNGVTQGY